MSSEVWAFLGAILGGVGLKLVEKLLSKREVEFSQNLDLIRELRAQITELTQRQDALEQEVVTWKDKYYKLLEEWTILKSEAAAAKKEAEETKKKLNELILQVNSKTH